jgi:Holliday junction resolvasome RuvABC endonuclease subunit
VTLLCLDLATVTGWALRGPSGALLSGTQSFAINARVEGAGMRYLRFRHWMDTMHSLYPISRLAFEEVKQRAASVAAGHMYGGFMATLTSWCEERGVPYEGIPVQTIKKHVTGKGNASKEDVIKAMRAKGHQVEDDNEADALALLYYVMTYATPSTPDIRPALDRSPERRVPLDPLRLPRRPVSR